MSRTVLITAFVCLALAMTTYGCASRDTAATTAPTTNGDGAWFCQIAANGAGWDCIQDPEQARNPKPSRLPAAPEPSPARSSSRPLPLAAANVANTGSVAEPGAAPSATGMQEPPDDPPARAEAPPYVALAYHPDQPVTLMNLPSAFYAVQLMAVEAREDLESFARKHGLSGMSAARDARNDRLYYVLLLGVYESYDSAKRASAELPPPFDDVTPWIRPVGELQTAITRADELAGNPTSWER